MSGDLLKPNRAIPKGTLAAVSVTGISYILLTLLIGATTKRSTLIQSYTFMADVRLEEETVL